MDFQLAELLEFLTAGNAHERASDFRRFFRLYDFYCFGCWRFVCNYKFLGFDLRLFDATFGIARCDSADFDVGEFLGEVVD
jgi:hypothetical protein